jgi:predicted secreted protein
MDKDRRSTRTRAGSARQRLLAAGLVVLLLLAGCVSRAEVRIDVDASGSWSGELQLFLPAAAATARAGALDAQVEQQVAILLGNHGIDYSWEKTATADGGVEYTFRLQGPDLKAFAGALLDEQTVGLWLSGPIVLDLQGTARAGQSLEIALPARPSTGYGWAVKSTSGGLAQVGVVESRQVQAGMGTLSRQVVRFQAGADGPAGFQLLYRRPWLANAAPDLELTLRVDGVDLAAACAALSMPDTTLPAPAGVPDLAASAPGSAPESPAPLQANYNWCTTAGCTPIKDQGTCGSCWSFGTVGVLEQNILIHDTLTKDLSEQYLLSCNTDGYDCNGGWWAHDYHLSKIPPGEPAAGAVYEADFPYQADDTVPCNPPHTHHEKIVSWDYVSGDWPSVAALKQAIVNHGPVAVAICVGAAFQGYTGGVFETDEAVDCGIDLVNHAVLLVGWDDNQGTSGVWILRNSWNTSWGESGYMRIGYNVSHVGYGATYVVYTPAVPPAAWVYLPLVYRDYNPSSTPVNLFEGFEGGVVPPSGWTAVNTNPRQNWKIATVGTPHTGTYAADVEYDDQLALQDEILLSPVLSLSAGNLDFWSLGSLFWCRDTHDNCDLDVWLVVGAWGGGDDVYVMQADDDWTGTWVWSHSAVNLGPYLPGGPVRIAFRYTGQDGAQIKLDDVTLNGSGLALSPLR